MISECIKAVGNAFVFDTQKAPVFKEVYQLATTEICGDLDGATTVFVFSLGTANTEDCWRHKR